MDVARVRAALRFDSGGWRRFAELGCVWGPEWWKRGSPPVIAAIVFAIAREQRAAVRRNQLRVRGPRPWLVERWHAYRVFAEFARAVTESMEQWGPRARPIVLDVIDRGPLASALAEGRGVVIPTGHFGGWEVGARFLTGLGRPVNLVVAQEPNPTVHPFMHRLRTRHGIRVIYSGGSVFAALPVLAALRRHEVVGMQIDPWGGAQGSHTIDFFGAPARFQLGPFAVARVARAPVVPVFAVRMGIRRYELRTFGRFDPVTPADAVAALTATVRAYERLVRERPQQWLMFDDVWRDPPVETPAYEMVPQASGLRRR